MAINVFRYDPQMFIPIIKRVRNTNPIARQQNNTSELILAVEIMERLSPIRFDEPANMACRRNNDRVLELNEDYPEACGNIEMF